MADASSSIKLKELLARHSELEQSETKAQAALVMILCFTQITELKLLLDIGRQGHRFYDFVLTMLVACISLEIFVGVVIMYIGNLHYYRSSSGSGGGDDDRGASRRRAGGGGGKTAGPYQSVHEMTASSSAQTAHSASAGARRPLTVLDVDDSGLGSGGGGSGALEPFIDLERADAAIELARVKAADADVRIVRAAGYVRVVEDAVRKTTTTAATTAGPRGGHGSAGDLAGSAGDFEAELGRARDDLAAAEREKAESEAERRLAEAQRHRAVYVRERRDELQERTTFRRVSFWQHGATYLLYFVMLMNVFITTFGITTGPPPGTAAAAGAARVAVATNAPAAAVTEGPSQLQHGQTVVTPSSSGVLMVGRHNISEIMLA